MDKFTEARMTHDMHTILGTEKKTMVCPLPMHIHQNKTPSFSIFWKDGVQYFKCHGNCGAAGDVIDLVGYLFIPGYQHTTPMRHKAIDYLDNRYTAEIIKIEKPIILDPYEWAKFVPPGIEAVEYAKSRGLDDDSILRFNLGQCGKYLSMPCFQDGNLHGVKMRRISGGGLRFWGVKGSRLGLFNYDHVAYRTGTILIVKGEIPAMILDQLGYLACAPTGGEGSKAEIDAWKTALCLAKKRVVIGDNDATGYKYGQERASLLDASLAFPTSDVKDWDEWYRLDPDQAVKMIESLL